eukprot:5660845-Amphidinium_carterae.1
MTVLIENLFTFRAFALPYSTARQGSVKTGASGRHGRSSTATYGYTAVTALRCSSDSFVFPRGSGRL